MAKAGTDALPPRLTTKQAAFRDAILEGWYPSEAYKRAFNPTGMSPKAIANEAQKYLNHPKISHALSLAGQAVVAKAEVLPPLPAQVRLSMEARLEELHCAARLDPAECFDELNHFKSIREMPPHVRRAIAMFKVDPISFVTEVRFVDKRGAIMDYSKLAGDIPREERKPTAARQVQYDLAQLTDEELREHLRLRRKAMIVQSSALPEEP